MLIQTVGCTLVEIMVDENGKAIHSSFETSGEADKYFDEKQEEWLKEQEENKRKLKEYKDRLAKERKNKKKFTTDFKQ